MELELLMSEDSVDEREDVRLDDCSLEELVESSQRHSSIVMMLTDDEIPLEMIEEMVVGLERSEDEKVEEDKYEDESGDEGLISEEDMEDEKAEEDSSEDVEDESRDE
jgi:hypothetical protein